MAIAITPDERALADVARSFAAANKLRRATRDAYLEQSADRGPYWQVMAELGWTGLHLPEEYGGSGAGLSELAIVLEELGAAVAPGPLLSAVIGSAILDRHGSDQLRARLLPAAANGSAVIAFAIADSVTLDGAGQATGTVPAVLGGIWADHLLIASGDDVLSVPVDPQTVELVACTDALDPSCGMARAELTGATVEILAGAASSARAVARTLAAAEASGGAQATLAMALDYAKIREQFGRTIGSFQAVKHHLANMLVDAERATSVAWDSARASAAAPEQAQLAAAVAGAVAFDAYTANAQLNIQIHGGIGFTWEHDAHLYLRRALTLSAVFGSVDAMLGEVYAASAAGAGRQYAIDLPPEAERYRAEAREFITRLNATPRSERRHLLVETGYLVPHWPTPWGRGATAVEQLVLDQEFRDTHIPSLGIGGWVLLTLVQHSSAEQIERWIAPSLEGELVWCQLFSEPNAGSDAAAVQTKATRVEGGWRISGQKVWTSRAAECNRGLATVRTDPSAAKHKGITTVVVDVTAPGVDIRPLREITGEAVFNEVFFDDVFIPDTDVVGEVNAGWTVARATLGNERVSIGGSSRDALSGVDLVDVLQRYHPGDTGMQRAVGHLIAVDQTVRVLNLRRVARAVAGTEAGAEGSVTKLLIAEQAQHLSATALRIAGAAGVEGSEPKLVFDYLMARSLTIAGGTSEISRNVIAERLLGLPRDPLNR